MLLLSSGCMASVAVPVTTGIIGIADSADKNHRLMKLEERVSKIESRMPKPYPMYTKDGTYIRAGVGWSGGVLYWKPGGWVYP